MYQSAAAPITGKSLVIDLLSTMPSHFPVPVAALVRAAALFGIGESSLRVTLVRLRSSGQVESDQRGLYRLSPAALPLNRRVRSWPSIEEGVGPWDGGWIAVEMSGLPRRDRRRSRGRERALRMLGFEALTPALQIRPNNIVGGAELCRRRLEELGFVPAPVVFQLTDLDESTDRRARELWHVDELEARYSATRELLVKSAQRLPSLSLDDAMAESFRLGGEAVRLIVLDPLLPDEILDTGARRALVEEMRSYDQIGRRAWKQWAGASVELERSPVGIGELETLGAATPVADPA